MALGLAQYHCTAKEFVNFNRKRVDLGIWRVKEAYMSSLISEIQRSLQYAVSGDKYRLREGQWDLDLTYITPRIIAMGIPGDGVSSNWRNNIKDVSSFFHAKHANHFRIYNLSGDSYNYGMFNNSVAEYPFPDHHPPPLDVFLACLKDMHQWLSSDADNVLAVHCLAGRSRTGTIVSGYLLYSSFSENALRAISYFNSKRSLEAKDICLPSQIRYVGYLDSLLQDHERTALRRPETRILRAVIISAPFRLEGSVKRGSATWKPHIRLVNQSLPQETIFKKTYPSVNMNLPHIRLEIPSVALKADVMIKISHVSSNPITYAHACLKIQKAVETATSLDSDLTVDVARISFHTSFLESDSTTFEAFEIDAHKAGPINTDGKYIPSNLRVTLEFEPKSSPRASATSTTHSVSPNREAASPASSRLSTGSSPHVSASPRTSQALGQMNNLGPINMVDIPIKGGAVSRPRNKSDPMDGGRAVLPSPLANGTSSYYHASSTSSSSSSTYSTSSTSSSTYYVGPGYAQQPVGRGHINPVADGHAHGFSGIGVPGDQLDAIAEFKAEQAARKQAALNAHVASSPVQNKYLPPGNSTPQILVSPSGVPMAVAPVIAHPTVVKVPSATGPIPMTPDSPKKSIPNGYPPGYVPPTSSTGGYPPAGYPPGYVAPAPASSRKRPVSVHFGAVPVSNGSFSMSPMTGATTGVAAPVPVAQPVEAPYVSSGGYNPYQNPYAPVSQPYSNPPADNNPYKYSKAAAVPSGWPPGHPNSYPNPYAPVVSSGYPPPASSNPYAPRSPVVQQWRWD